ncbi:GEVED domain-containing protein [Pontibacter sp. G13]|uniref:GEVED domain-containing protein n=1 Tax=Pontibacter sp. G13 TaxID=3074898 RepID=UPI00288AAFCB|nr:GEVED domain-containing protein [Pontibacter sp. G13]WNJ21190.1 GEVED domain-containing protein [Pontibacter sp. G13]
MKHLFTLIVALGMLWGTAFGQYCVPSYSTGTAFGDSIVSFSVNTIVGNYPGSSTGYNDYTLNDTTTLQRGQTYTATIVNNPTYTSGVSVWIDYNNDSTFDASELLGSVTINGGGTESITFTVPGNALLSTTRLRMTQNYNSLPAGPCASMTYGETEDYSVTITAPSGDDVGVVAVAPFAFDCGSFTSGVEIEAVVGNFGVNAASSINVYYSINGGTPVLETISSLLGGLQDTVTFTTLAQLPNPNTAYDIDVWTELTGDVDAGNDTVTISFTTPFSNSFPFAEDFESFTPGTGSSFNPGTLANGWTTFGTNDGWYVKDNTTPSFGTGPSGNHTQGGSVYMYTESSNNFTAGAFYSLLSPCVDMSTTTGPAQLRFWYHMFGSGIGTLEVHALYNGMDTTLWTLTGGQQFAEADPWLEAVVDMSFLTGEVFQLEFRGIDSGSSAGDIAIDDIMLFAPAATDAGVTEIVSPTDPACYSSTESVTVRVKNLGTSTIDMTVDPITVSLDISGAGTQAFSTVVNTGTLDVDSTLDVVVTTNANLSAAGTYNFLSYTTVGADPNAFNDSTTGSVDALPLLTSGMFEDFETFNSTSPQTLYPNGWTASSITTSTSTSIGWRGDVNGTGSGSTGPSGDHTFASGGVNGSGIYMYTEMSGAPSGSIFDLTSPCLDVSSITCPKLTFWYHMYGAGIGELQVVANVGGVETILWSLSGQQQGDELDPYREAVVDLSGYTGVGSFNVTFRVLHPSGQFTGDIAIDDVEISQPVPVNVAALDVTSPAPSCTLGASETVSVNIFNAGTQNLTGITASFSVDGGAFTTPETVPGTLNACDTTNYTFTATADISAGGTHTITVVTQVAGDTLPGNDTTELTIYTFPVGVASFPYLEDFETGPGGWTAVGANSTWAFGTPAKNFITGAASGDSAWVTGGLTTATTYNNNESSWVLGPCFDFTNVPNPVFRANIWWESTTSDGAVLQGSVDGGNSWITIGDVGDPNNWYNQSFIFGNPGGGTIGWSGSETFFTPTGAGGWLPAEHRMDTLGGYSSVQLRIAFGTDGFTNSYDGFAFDDIQIFQLPAYNAAALDIPTPFSGCGLSDSAEVTMTYTNMGADTIFSMDISFQVDGGTIVTETVNDTLLPGDTTTYAFVGTADLSTPGNNYSVVAWTSLAGDPDAVNDTVTKLVTHKAAITSYPYTETFDSWPNSTSNVPGVNALPNGWENLQTDAGQEWATWTGGTTSSNTGPVSDHTTGSGNYMYVEDSGQENDSVIMVTPCFDLSFTNQALFTFWYHSHNANDPNDENMLHIDVEENGVLYYDVIPPIGHDANNDWALAQVSMANFSGIVSVRFRVDNNNGWFSHDIAIDDVNMLNIIPNDAGIALNFFPESGCGLTNQEDIVVALANFGTDTLNGGITVNYDVALNGSSVSSGNVISNDTIVPGNFVPFFINNQPFAAAGTYTVTVWTSGVNGDTNVANDSLVYEVVSVPTITTYPYFEDFEGADPKGGWRDEGSNSTWAFGYPSKNNINTAASDSNVWVTGGLDNSSTYNNNEDSYVIGPCFDFTSILNPVIKFEIWHESEFSWDGSNLQSSIDGGLTWVNVGNLGDPDNWYNDGTINGNPGGNQTGWTGSSGGWVTAEHDLDSLGGQPSVLLRVTFGSDGSVNSFDGFAFDDILIYERPDDDVELVSLIGPSGLLCTTDSLPLSVVIGNEGLVDQDSVPVFIDVTGPNGTYTVSNVYTDTLVVDSTDEFYVGQFPASDSGTYSMIAYTALAGDTVLINDSAFLSIFVNLSPDAPTVFSDSVCNTDSAMFTLMASGNTTNILWYDSIGGEVIAYGDTFNTPMLSQTTTYYAAAANQSNYTGFTPADNTIGNGGIYTFFGDGIEFDALADIEINTVKVYPGGAGIIGVTLTDNGGNVIQSTTIPFGGTVSDTVVTLNFTVPQGAGYELSATGSTVPNLYRNSGGATFPYEIPSVISLTGTINGLGSSGYYYFFYDWTVTALGCESEPVPVYAKILDPVAVDLGSDGTVCSGYTLDATGAGITSYIWNSDSSITTPTFNVDTTGLYTVDVMNADGCTGADTVVLFVTPSPEVDLGVDTASCDSFMLDAGNPGALYVWSDPSNVGQTYTATTSGQVWVSVTANGCTTTDTVDVTINAAPMVALGGSTETCLPVTLDAGMGMGYTYDWSTGESTQTIDVVPPSTGTDTITVTVTSAEGCVSTDMFELSEAPAPVVDLGADTTACDTVGLGVVAEAGYSYLWSTNDTTVDVTIFNTGDVTLTVTDALGCEATDTIFVTVNETPSADFDIDHVGGAGYDYSFINLSTPAGDTTASYLWDFGDGGTSTDENPFYTYQFDGSFPITLIVTNDCGSDTLELKLDGVFVDELFGGNLDIYPNPTAGIVNLSADQVAVENLTIEVLDARGRLVSKKTRDNVYGVFNEQVDLSNLPEAVYTIRLTDGEYVTVTRVIVRR